MSVGHSSSDESSSRLVVDPAAGYGIPDTPDSSSRATPDQDAEENASCNGGYAEMKPPCGLGDRCGIPERWHAGNLSVHVSSGGVQMADQARRQEMQRFIQPALDEGNRFPSTSTSVSFRGDQLALHYSRPDSIRLKTNDDYAARIHNVKEQ